MTGLIWALAIGFGCILVLFLYYELKDFRRRRGRKSWNEFVRNLDRAYRAGK